MTNRVWQLIPRVGIASGSVEISFGQERAELSRILADDFLAPAKTTFADEDDFHSEDKSVFIRVRYSGTQVQDIEFLGGVLEYQGIQLHSDVTFSELEEKFGAKNFTFRPTEWLGDGQDCPELNINVATHEDVGGDGDGIEWVILSQTFT